MQLATKPFDGGVCVTVEDTRVDAAVAVHFKDRVRELFSEYQGRALMNLEHVDFIDSSGLGALVAVMKSLPDGKKLEVVGLTPIVEKVIRLTRMDKVFILHRNLDEATGTQNAA